MVYDFYFQRILNPPKLSARSPRCAKRATVPGALQATAARLRFGDEEVYLEVLGLRVKRLGVRV